MPEFLVFTLAAPFAAFGAVAVGERRPTWDRPSKSQIVGLIAGCLGIERADEDRQMQLARSVWMAVRIDDPGRIATDYHTAQVPPQRRNRRFRTRAEELAVDKTELKTILSRREMRLGSHYTIALSPSDAKTNAPPLADIESALRTPVFAPYAGRKANALMLPMTPHILSEDDVTRAFAAYDALRSDAVKKLCQRFWLTPHPQTRPRIYLDPELLPTPHDVDRYEERRDMPQSRAKWRFDLRTEALLKSRGGAP